MILMIYTYLLYFLGNYGYPEYDKQNDKLPNYFESDAIHAAGT